MSPYPTWVSAKCHYCGKYAAGRELHRDHFIPKSKGGISIAPNIVPACQTCNSTKGNRTIEAARPSLLLQKIGWPKFTRDQLDWLRAKDFDLSELDNAALAFEEAKNDRQ